LLNKIFKLKIPKPICLKISPDIDYKDVSQIIELAKKFNINGLIISNTTIENREELKDTKKSEEGGLSGQPLKHVSTKMIKEFYKGTNKKITIIGVGGVDSGESAFEKISAGASAIQLYTGMIFRGPTIARDIKNELISIKDSIIKIASFLRVSNVSKSMSKLETQILLSKNQNELTQNKIKYNTYLYILIISSIVLFFILITMRINYNFQKEKNNRLIMEQEIISKDLENKNLQLISSTNFISQRNEYLKSLRNKIKTLEENKDSNESSEFISKNIKRNIDNIINSEKTFESFEKQFTKVYPDFFKKLIEKHGKLTSTDLRLCAYLRMNQNSSEIAQITGASIRTIESQRYRLRKKLNLKPENDILNYLITL